jgi:hypothetical protein
MKIFINIRYCDLKWIINSILLKIVMEILKIKKMCNILKIVLEY